mgnify:CR=1 FL=1
MLARGSILALCVAFIGAFLCLPCLASSDDLLDLVVVDRTTRDKTLNDYTHLTRSAIQRSWNTPVHLATTGALKGKIAINYCISRDGRLESVELIRGSGNAEMDRTLVEAIRAAAPFPSFPDYMLAKRVLIKANFIVADQPLAPITTVQHSVKRSVEQAPTEVTNLNRKFDWGVSAGHAGDKQKPSVDTAAPLPAPPAKKYKWGLP